MSIDALALNTSQQVFMLFYAIFWGTIANAQPRWKAFQLPLVGKVGHVKWRVGLSFLLLNLFPLVLFVYVLWPLHHVTIDQSHDWWFFRVLQSVVPAFAVFGFYRLWLGIVEKCPDCFYVKHPEDLEARYRHVEPTYGTDRRRDGLPSVDLGSDTACANIRWAVGYIVVGLVVPWL